MWGNGEHAFQDRLLFPKDDLLAHHISEGLRAPPHSHVLTPLPAWWEGEEGGYGKEGRRNMVGLAIMKLNLLRKTVNHCVALLTCQSPRLQPVACPERGGGDHTWLQSPG